MNLEDLKSDGVRNFMAEEVELDIEREKLYMSKRLKTGFENNYITLLQDAIVDGDTGTFAQCILNEDCLKNMEPSKRSSTGMKKVPKNAHETLGEGEFNRFYCRGVCRKAIEEGHELEIYRAKQVQRPRSASLELIGKTVDPKQLLEDLRKNIGVDTALGVPKGPNSGLSVKIRNNV